MIQNIYIHVIISKSHLCVEHINENTMQKELKSHLKSH